MNVVLILCDTLRRDHLSPYNLGKRLCDSGSRQQPPWIIPTPNVQRLANRGTVFEHAWCGSTPCMPARRDIYTGRYEFLERGWGPLEEDDIDLPGLISGKPNQSLQKQVSEGFPVSYLITDHFHLWERGSGNYHMNYSGFEFIRGHESDAWKTDLISLACPEHERLTKMERHYRNIHKMRQTEQDWFSAQVFRNAGDWLSKNHNHHSFFLHIDCFDPHEPWDPPDEFVKLFHPNGYDVAKEPSTPPYGQWQLHMTEESMNLLRAKYAAHVMLLDRSLGVFLDKMDELDLWKNTVVMFVSDHGTYNGDHGRMGKLQTHEHDAVGHIPFIIAHPLLGRGQRRNQLVQLVDIYPTVLKLLERPVPDNIHGVDLLPVLEDGRKETRQYAIAGQFGKSMTITDSEWIMHKSPVDGNSPLFWYGHCLSRFQKYELGEYREGRREVYQCDSWNAPTWLSDKKTDINELMNLAEKNPKKVSEMKEALKKTLLSLNAPEEQILRLGL